MRTVLVAAVVGALASAPAAAKAAPKPHPSPHAKAAKAKPSPPPPGTVEEKKKLPGFGEVDVYRPAGLARARGVVLFVSGDGGWNLGVVDMARRLSGHAIVAGLSMPAWQKRVEATKARCWYPAGELETAAQALEKLYALPRYVRPILVGYSSGATVVYGALAQSPPITFRGAVSLGFCPDLEVKKPLCGTPGWSSGWNEAKHQSWLPAFSRMTPREGGGDKWIALQGLIDQVCAPQGTIDYVAKVPNAAVVSLPHVGHGFSVPSHWGSAFDEAVGGMLEPDSVLDPRPHTVRQDDAHRTPVDVAARLEALDLPLEVVWPKSPTAVLVFVSGDGGWADLDSHVAKGLASHGIAVVGWNTLRYFWLAKTPERFEGDLTRLLAALPGRLPVFVGGYSFGAESVPVVVAAGAKTGKTLARLAGLVLLAPGPYATFEVSPLDWIRTHEQPTSHPVAASVSGLDAMPVLCLEPKSSETSGCPSAPRTGYLHEELPGGHHFDGDYDGLVDRIASFVQANSRP
jgi:type IV secretory pathway VirJ component